MLLKILILVFVSTNALGQSNGPVSLAHLNTYKECSSSDQSMIDQIETFLENTYEKIKAEKKISSWEMEDRKSRIAHYCYEECACVGESFSKSLKAKYKDQLDVFGIRVHGGLGLLPVEITRGKYKSSYNYHVATVIKIKASNCYVISDPIMNGPTLMSATTWTSHIPTIEQNRLHLWKR